MSSPEKAIKVTHKPLRIVLTGVENSGKSTLIQPLAERFNWPYILELCRENKEVLHGEETFKTLQELHKLNEKEVAKVLSLTNAKGIFCDTGILALDVWSELVFGKEVSEDNIHSNSDAEVDLYLLCETVKEWEPDPIRLFPNYNKRVEVNELFLEKLKKRGLAYVFVPILPLEQRVAFIEQEIRLRFDV
ncbi:ATP-binding protein [Algibacter sp.]|nr:ATP-binding protein [Algibacter sp.]